MRTGRNLLGQVSVSHERSSAALERREEGVGFLSALPLTGVPPGHYVIHVEAGADAGDRRPVSRDIPIQIR